MAPALVVYLNRKPTDDEMRAVHELIGESERLRAENARLRVKRCHYCDAPMKERDVEHDGVVIGVSYDCSDHCAP